MADISSRFCKADVGAPSKNLESTNTWRLKYAPMPEVEPAREMPTELERSRPPRSLAGSGMARIRCKSAAPRMMKPRPIDLATPAPDEPRLMAT